MSIISIISIIVIIITVIIIMCNTTTNNITESLSEIDVLSKEYVLNQINNIYLNGTIGTHLYISCFLSFQINMFNYLLIVL